jgi:hypothetical protein
MDASLFHQNEFKFHFQTADPPRRPNEFCCHAAATRGENRRDQEGRAGTPEKRKPAWSLQEREMIDDLGLRWQGFKSRPLRQLCSNTTRGSVPGRVT